MPGTQQNPAYMRNSEDRSPSDVYKLNGDCSVSHNETRSRMSSEEDAMLLSLFKEQDQPPGLERASTSHTCHTWLPHAHAHSSANNASAGYNPLHQTNIYSNNPYLGGPNVTCPAYSHIPGGILGEETKASPNLHHDSSSSSESESSHSSSNLGKFESQHNSARSTGIRMNKDEKLAREAGIQLKIKQDIVDPPMDEFNDMLSKEDLTEEQLNICRDIRRRGKNKVAAQNCRKRKLEQIDELQKKVDEAKGRRNLLAKDHKRLLEDYTVKVNNYTSLVDSILAFHNKSPLHYTVIVNGDDVSILPKTSIPEDQRFPKSPDSLRYRPPPPPPPLLPDISYNNGNMMFSQNNQHSSYNRAWDH